MTFSHNSYNVFITKSQDIICSMYQPNKVSFTKIRMASSELMRGCRKDTRSDAKMA